MKNYNEFVFCCAFNFHSIDEGLPSITNLINQNDKLLPATGKK